MSEDDKPRDEPAAKAKLPNAKNIRSPEFTPHGISAGRGAGGPRPSALTAGQHKRRRILLGVVGVVAVAAVIGGVTFWVTRPGPEISVSGDFGAKPKVTIPAGVEPVSSLSVSTPIEGEGPKTTKDSTIFAKFVYYKWSRSGGEDHRKKGTNEEVANTYDPTPQQEQQGIQPLMLGKTGLPGVDEGLVGRAEGSRVLLQIPPNKGFGEQGTQMGIAKNDALIFVIDLISVYNKDSGPSGTQVAQTDGDLPKVKAGKTPADAPKVTIPETDAPDKLQSRTLIEGTGPKLAKDSTAILHYQGRIWRNGKEFDSSYGDAPRGFPLSNTVPGFATGLADKTVGSRVLLVLPPSDGYGKEGNPQAGIKGDDTIVFVVDILGVVPK